MFLVSSARSLQKFSGKKTEYERMKWGNSDLQHFSLMVTLRNTVALTT